MSRVRYAMLGWMFNPAPSLGRGVETDLDLFSAPVLITFATAVDLEPIDAMLPSRYNGAK